MSFIEVATGVIALSTAVLAVRAVRPITKKRHFKARVEQTDRSIWDLEFSREKYKMLREDIRQQYDRVNENVLQAKTSLSVEQAKSAPDAKVVENLQNLVARYEPDIEYLKKQMEALDNQIDCESNPEACTQKLEATRALREMLRSYAKKL